MAKSCTDIQLCVRFSVTTCSHQSRSEPPKPREKNPRVLDPESALIRLLPLLLEESPSQVASMEADRTRRLEAQLWALLGSRRGGRTAEVSPSDEELCLYKVRA